MKPRAASLQLAEEGWSVLNEAGQIIGAINERHEEGKVKLLVYGGPSLLGELDPATLGEAGANPMRAAMALFGMLPSPPRKKSATNNVTFERGELRIILPDGRLLSIWDGDLRVGEMDSLGDIVTFKEYSKERIQWRYTPQLRPSKGE